MPRAGAGLRDRGGGFEMEQGAGRLRSPDGVVTDPASMSPSVKHRSGLDRPRTPECSLYKRRPQGRALGDRGGECWCLGGWTEGDGGRLPSAHSFSGLRISTHPSALARCPTAARSATSAATTETCTPTWSSSTSVRWKTRSPASRWGGSSALHPPSDCPYTHVSLMTSRSSGPS